MVSLANFTKDLNSNSSSAQSLPKIEEGGIVTIYIKWDQQYRKSRLHKDNTKKRGKLQASILHTKDAKILNEILTNFKTLRKILLKINNHDQVVFILPDSACEHQSM